MDDVGPDISWNLVECKRYASDLIDALLSFNLEKMPNNFPRIFKDFVQANSLNAGMTIGAAFSTYMITCENAKIDKKIYPYALREVVEEKKDQIHKWYYFKLQN